MLGELATTTSKGIEDELDIFTVDPLDGLLNNVVPVHVLHATDDIGLQLRDEVGLLACQNVLDRFLHDSAAIHLRGQNDQMSLHRLSDLSFLYLVTVIEEFLNDIVAEHILHELHDIRFDLFEDELLLVAVGLLDLVLDEARSLLITAEFCNVALDVAKCV